MNNPIHTAIIEDEQPAARLLDGLIKKLRPEWNTRILPGSVKEASKWLGDHTHPDLLFLDIRLSDGNAFDLLSVAKPHSTIIFTTAYDQYALRAFSVNSIDYILKPVDEQRLAEAIAKFEQHYPNQRHPEDYIETIIDTLQHQEKRYRTRFLIAKANRYHTLQVDDIAYFYSENRITTAVTFTGNRHAIDLPLSRLEEQLDPDLFFRANRQVLLRVTAIVKIEPYFNGRITVSVKPPYKGTITISEDKITAFKMWLNY